MILARGDVPACGETVLLLSDGAANEGSDPLSLVADLRARGVRVLAIGIGVDVETAFLQALADSTDGTYFQILTAEDVPEVASAVASAVRAAGTLFTADDFTNGQDESIPILIDTFAEEVTFLLGWDEATLDMDLTTPGGERITVESADFREDVEAERQNGLIYIRVSRPEQANGGPGSLRWAIPIRSPTA
jgi:hypothetical protein